MRERFRGKSDGEMRGYLRGRWLEENLRGRWLGGNVIIQLKVCTANYQREI